GATLDGQLGDVGDLRQPEALGDHRGHDAHGAVGGGHTGEDDVGGADLLDGLARMREVAGASDPAIASSETCTPLSAPIWRDFFTASAASAGPTVRTVTSPSFASLSCSACSTAYSSSSESS